MLTNLLYGLLLCFLYPLARLPRCVLFVLSDVVYFFFYHVLSYRKSVVYTNLARSFPEKSYSEIKNMAGQYYHYFADLFFENIKTLGVSAKKASSFITFENAGPVIDYDRQGQNTVWVLGHFGNWEYLNFAGLYFNLKIAYKPQHGVVDKLMKRIRTHYLKSIIIPMQQISRYMLTHQDEHVSYVFIADQSPSSSSKAWTTFLHQDSLFFEGAEKLATRCNLPVFYVEMLRVARGKYKVIFTKICDDPKSLPEFEITRRFAALLEQSINRNPQYWLWSHKRWKHKQLKIKN
ncbi:MAG: lysophospholipid acyltransferase family protein [Prevotellaceae bacterium]|jgi:KDO2-lipid IV(A) lauroyltransferase|nr:lysophospholipid acyltransferase family protein [Prevotellaceae bacterium]